MVDVGAAARVVSLQRTVGNRAIGRLLQRQLRGKPGVVSGSAPLNEQRGRQILEEFSRNDRASVANLVGSLPNWLDDQEWGLIRETATGEVHLIRGESKGVIWGSYLTHGEPIAHSHPWGEVWYKRSTKRPANVALDKLVKHPYAGPLVLPTVSDFVFPGRRGQTAHTVYTPYVVAGGQVRDPEATDAQSPRLIFELTEISVDEANEQMTGRLTAKSGGQQLWTHRVQASTDNLRSTKYTLLDPQPVAGAITAQTGTPQPVVATTNPTTPQPVVGATTGLSDD